jgi:outer membrane immunogenic protein
MGILGTPISRTLALSLALSAVGLVHANAADVSPSPYKAMPVFPVTGWAGFYAGAHVGGAWSNMNTTNFNENGSLTPGINTSSLGPQTFSNNASGVFGGGTVGYNLQRGQFVFGLEADFGAMGLSRKTPQPVPFNSPIVAESHGGGYGDVTGRFGVAFDQSLIYAKGGVAFFGGDAKVIDVPDRTTATTQSSPVGWTVGAGIEYMIAPAWSMKAEYQFFDFGSGTNQMMDDGDRFRTDLSVHTVKAGVSYHFGK